MRNKMGVVHCTRPRGSRPGPAWWVVAVILPLLAVSARAADRPRSEPISAVLRQPLAPEALSTSTEGETILISGPTFTYTVDRRSGAIVALEVRRSGQPVVSLSAPAQLHVDGYRLGPQSTAATTELETAESNRIVLKTAGELLPSDPSGSRLAYRMASVFYNDGVVVADLTLLPAGDLPLRRGIRHELELEGRFQQYLHKVHSRYGGDPRDRHLVLPPEGGSVALRGLTSCLQVLSHQAAVAIFTDRGAIHVSPPESETASLRVVRQSGERAHIVLAQHIVQVGPQAEPYILSGGREFRFRFGMSVAPNRHRHRRSTDLRHFVWIGDGEFPYPADDEIRQVAQLGFTVFQMHRLGELGSPRPPAGELERVIRTVHENGMLFLWLTLPDLIDSHSQQVQTMRAAGQWPSWEASHYGGRYVAKMDPYCDWFGTCTGAPNGLAEYHIDSARRMMDRYDVDGIYLDDNIARGGACQHWQLHGHPREGYDCLIEMHEVNWRRRQVLLERRPHALLIDHCTTGMVLPVICDFDVHLYGEGAASSAPLDYWNFYGSIRYMDAHGNIWPGDTEASRFEISAGYNLDLLTGGGQYSYIDWRLFPKKFPYAAGVREDEAAFIRTFNLAQYFFGMYESEPHYFATSGELLRAARPTTLATLYHNQVWNDYLIAIANTAASAVQDSLTIQAAGRIGLNDATQYLVFDVINRTCATATGVRINDALRELDLPALGMRLLYVRPQTAAQPRHLWGGKRLEEHWDDRSGRLQFKLLGPPGLRDEIFIAVNDHRITDVTVNGQPAKFLVDSALKIAHGNIEFTGEPVVVEAVFSTGSATTLPEARLNPQALAEIYQRAGAK